MRDWIEKPLRKIMSPRLDWVQVEITTWCNAACIYCPHTILGEHWENAHMTPAFFRRLIPFIQNTSLIYLQGWGEPLLNKDIFEMIRICKDHGRRVGFTTNGMLLNEKTIRKLIELETDVIGVSLAGTTSATHDRIRRGTAFDRVISNLERLCWIKQKVHSPVPELNLAFLMLVSNFHELKQIIPLAKRVGARQIVSSNLSLILKPELFSEAVFNDTALHDYYAGTLEETQLMAEREGIVFDYSRIGLDHGSAWCSENVCNSCVVSVRGDVTPCVFLNPVLSANQDRDPDKPADYIFRDGSYPLKALTFGNISQNSLTRIWRSARYAGFRELHQYGPVMERRPLLSDFPDRCVHCYKRIMA